MVSYGTLLYLLLVLLRVSPNLHDICIPGILKRYADRLHASLASLQQKGQSEIESFIVSPTTFVQDGLRISLLSREDGKEHVAKVTKSLAKGIQAGFIDKEEIDVDYLQEKIYCELFEMAG
jgi:undecaprenyl pyrophosphate synthase